MEEREQQAGTTDNAVPEPKLRDSRVFTASLEGLEEALRPWVADFEDMEARTQLFNRMDDVADAAFTSWTENVSYHITDRHNSIPMLRSEVDLEVVQVVHRLRRHVQHLSDLPGLDRNKILEATEGFVSAEDVDAFFDWVKTEAGTHPRGANWAAGPILQTVKELLAARALWLQPEAGTLAVAADQSRTGPAPGEQAMARSEDIRLQQREARRQHRERARKAALARKAAVELHQRVANDEATAELPAEEAASLKQSVEAVKAISLKHLGELERGQKTPFCFRPKNPEGLGVGPFCMGDDDKRHFKVRGMVTIVKRQTRRPFRSPGPGEVTVSFDREVHRTWHPAVVSAFGRWGWTAK